MRIIIIVAVLLKLYKFLQILQLEHYDLNKYYKYITRNYIIFNLVSILSLILCYMYTDIFSLIIISIIMFSYLSYITIPSIIRLKFTNRINRLLFVNVLMLCTVMFVEVELSIVLYCLFEFLMIIPYILNKPIDYIINRKYLKRSTTKYNNFTKYKIGVTGSYGKTSTKNIINDILGKELLGSCSYKSYNTVLGISTYINDIPLEVYDYTILEFGASKVGDIKDLVNKFSVDIACVTEVGYMHLDTFKSIENIVHEKMSITNDCKVAILNYEQDLIRKYKVTCDTITYGFDYGDLRAINIVYNEFGSSFDVIYQNKYIDNFTIPLLGSHQILNSLCAIGVCIYIGIDYKKIKEHLSKVSDIEHRLTLKKYKDYQLLDDSYNSNIKGSLCALDVLNQVSTKKVLMTPGFVENNKVLKDLYKEFALKIKEVGCNVLLVDRRNTLLLTYELDNLDVKYKVFDTFKEAMNYFENVYNDDYYTLLIENDLPDNYKGAL